MILQNGLYLLLEAMLWLGVQRSSHTAALVKSVSALPQCKTSQTSDELPACAGLLAYLRKAHAESVMLEQVGFLVAGPW